MSGIAGFINFDGAPAEGGLLAAMMGRMSHLGLDGSGAWVEGTAALGHLLICVTPESIGERQPLVDPHSGLVSCWDGRLDNRAELLDSLGVHASNRGMPDSQLALLAYQKWGETCPVRFLGEFVLVVWDSRRRLLFCARDHLGGRNLFYHVSKNRFSFASEIKALLTLPEVVVKLDEMKLGCMLCSHPAFPEKTFYEGIQRIPPAHTMNVASGFGPVFRRYWNLEHEPELRLGSSAEYAEALRSHVIEAVRARLRSAYPVAAMLSGGLDSSSVAVIAARELRARGQYLVAVSNILPPEFSEPEGDEREFMDAVLRQEPNIEPAWAVGNRFPAMILSPSDWSRFDEPLRENNSYRTRELCRTATESGARVLFGGLGGDIAASYRGYGILEALAKSGRFVDCLRHLKSQTRITGRSVSSVLKTDLLRPLSPPWFLRVYDIFRRKRQDPWSGTPIEPKFAKRLGLVDVFREFHREEMLLHDSRILTCHQLNSGIPLPLGWAGQYEPTLEVRHPLFDRRLLEFCMRVPLREFSLGGVPRSLFRRAMAGILPVEILNRTTKGAFAPDFRQRGLSESSEVASFLSSHLENSSIWNYVRRSALESWLDGVRVGNLPRSSALALQRIAAVAVRAAQFLIQVQPRR